MQTPHNQRVKTFIAPIRDRIVSVLPAEKDHAVYLAMVAEYLSRNPDLFNCARVTLIDAVIDAALLGLELGPPFELASILPYKDKRINQPVAKLIVEYRGYMMQAYRSGLVKSIAGRPVYREDKFIFSFGLSPRLSHQPTMIGERGPLVNAYAIAQLADGKTAMEVITAHDAREARNDSPNSDHPRSLWKTREAQMWVKTAIKKLINRLPRSAMATAPGPPPAYAELLNAVSVSPDLYKSALTTLSIEKPVSLDNVAAILACMRDLYRKNDQPTENNGSTNNE